MRKLSGFIFVLLLGLVPFQSSAERFATGTDDDGVYYFPQEMAEWCELNFNDNINKAAIENCLIRICTDYEVSDFVQRRINKKRFEKLVLQAWTNAFLQSVEAKKKYANDKEEEKAEKTQENAGSSMRTQTSGNTEIGKEVLTMKKDLNQLKEILAELNAFSFLETNCKHFAVKGEEKKQ